MVFDRMTAQLAAISPMFIVRDVTATVAFYTRLGFELRFQSDGDEPFFAIVGRDAAQLFLKSHEGIEPIPNRARHPWLRLDAHVHVPDPDGLAAEFAAAGVAFSSPLQDTDDGLRGFEVTDPDGHVLFFGWPRA